MEKKFEIQFVNGPSMSVNPLNVTLKGTDAERLFNKVDRATILPNTFSQTTPLTVNFEEVDKHRGPFDKLVSEWVNRISESGKLAFDFDSTVVFDNGSCRVLQRFDPVHMIADIPVYVFIPVFCPSNENGLKQLKHYANSKAPGIDWSNVTILMSKWDTSSLRANVIGLTNFLTGHSNHYVGRNPLMPCEPEHVTFETWLRPHAFNVEPDGIKMKADMCGVEFNVEFSRPSEPETKE